MPANWNDRFRVQADWTKELRRYIITSYDLPAYARALEIGCGTGAVTADFHDLCNANLFGLDIDFQSTQFAMRNDSETQYLQGDALSSPFATGSFDVVFCHFFLLWIAQKLEVLHEALRILKPGGTFIAFAEPDYSGRVDAPSALAQLGEIQTKGLQARGADISCGRKLPSLLSESGFVQIKFGIIGHETIAGKLPKWWGSEWTAFRTDLKNQLSSQELDQLQEIDKKSWLFGSRVLWVPTFYALGKKPA